MGIETGISILIICAFFAWILKDDKPKKIEKIEISPGKHIEFLEYADYRTIICNIPEFKDNIVSSRIKIRLMDFPNLDINNPTHKFAADMILNIMSKTIENAKEIRLHQHLRGADGFYLYGRVFVDGVDISSYLDDIPDIKKYKQIVDPVDMRVPRESRNNNDRYHRDMRNNDRIMLPQ